ncbi:MAG TPA: hypothetical protein VL123_09430 [Candidatus Udaeobacter sp.]|jgi:hypothetical protein|nr:hypothetical protein [Candidatus Udaeobacter sp.]
MAVTADRLSPLARRLVPSFADLLFAFLLVTQIQPSLFSDADTGWHLWAGFQALAHGPGPMRDTLTWSRAGATWTSLQWLGEILLALSFRHARYLGVAVLCATVFAATFAGLYRVALARSRHVGMSLIVTLLAAAVTWTNFLARPVAFAYPLFLGIVLLARRERADARSAVGIVLLTVLWANTHPSAVLAPIFVALVGIGRRQRWLGIAAIGSLLALAVTPAGLGPLREITAAGSDVQLLRSLDEWKRPRFQEPRYFALLALMVIAIAARLRRKWGMRRVAGHPAATGFEGIAWLAGSLMVARLAPFAALAWAPELAADAARAGPGRAPMSPLERIAAPFESVLRPGLWPVLLAAAMMLAAPRLTLLFPEAAGGFPPHEFPVAALAAADRLEIGPRLLASYDWGGFVEWTSGGRRKVFVDGRGGLFAGPVLRDYLELSHAGPGWHAALERAAPDAILVPTRLPLARAAALDPGWQVAYRDSLAVLMVPRRH